MSKGVVNHKKRSTFQGSLDFDAEKLFLMQENLKLAAETISSLKQERDFFKHSSRTYTHEDLSLYPEKLESHEPCNKSSLSSELSTLKSIAKQREKTLEILNKKLKINKINLTRLQETNTKLIKSLSEKEEDIAKYEANIKYLQNSQENLKALNSSLRSENLEKSLKIQEIAQENASLNHLFELTNSTFSEQFKCLADEAGKKLWDKFVSRFQLIRSILTEQQKTIEDLKIQTKNNELVELGQVSKDLKKELKKLKSPVNKRGINSQIQEAAIEFIEIAHSIPGWHNSFKDFFVSPRTVQYLTENCEYGELLLKCFNFLINITPKPSFLKPSLSTQSLNQAESLLAQNCWTQTSDFNSSPRFSKPGVFSQSNSAKLFSNKSTQIKNHSNQDSRPQETDEPQISKEDQRKIFKESKQLFSLIDKQNSRLAKINSQISQLVPSLSDRGKLTYSESSVIINESINSSKEECIGKKHSNKLKTNWDSPVVISIKPGYIYRDREKVKRNYRVTESIQLRTPPKACSPELKPLDDSFYVNSEGENQVIENASPKNEKKRSVWDFSALKIPPKEEEVVETKVEIASKRVISPKIEPIPRRASRSPEAQLNRFKEYSRPKLRKEGMWNSVAEYFSGRYEEDV